MKKLILHHKSGYNVQSNTGTVTMYLDDNTTEDFLNLSLEQYKAFCDDTGRRMPESPEWGWQKNHPIVNVSFEDAVAYCDCLSHKFGGKWRLPTEAEWEYAARGGKKSNGYVYAGSNDLQELAWLGRTENVGSMKPNELGIYDMSYNVWEWCGDLYDSFYYTNSESNNPANSSKGSSLVVRGGCWLSSFAECRVAARSYKTPYIKSSCGGFRVVLSQ